MERTTDKLRLPNSKGPLPVYNTSSRLSRSQMCFRILHAGFAILQPIVSVGVLLRLRLSHRGCIASSFEAIPQSYSRVSVLAITRCIHATCMFC